MVVRAGDPLPRHPDRLLRGEGCFVADVELTAPLHLAFLRSPVAFARIVSLDIGDALLPGVHAIHGGADMAGLGKLSVNAMIPMTGESAYPILAHGTVQAVGQPVAAVLAESPAAALDGCEAIGLELEEETAADAAAIAEQSWQAGDAGTAFAGAAHVVRAEIRHPRLAPNPMEPRGIAVAWSDGGVTVWHSTQTPHRTRSELARILGVNAALIRVIAPDVGGAFGMKASLYPEEVCAVWAAFHHQRDVRWIATRSEDFLAATHGRGLTSRGRLALDAEGRFLALEADVTAPVGAWLPTSALVPAWNGGRILPGGYDVSAVDIRTRACPEHRAAMGIYRGAGRPEANTLMERLVDAAARATGIDPIEIRRRNLLRADRLPHRTATGETLDSGDYPAALDLLEDAGAYGALRAEQVRRRRDGALVGLGTAFYLEPSGSGWESARVTWQNDGAVHVASGSSAQGQSREIAYARIAAEALGVAVAQVSVSYGDTARCPDGIGALASRSTAIGGSAVLAACQRLKARRAAGERGAITEELRYENDGQAWGYGAYLVMLSIDRDTGHITLERMICVDDTGRVISPAQVTGQIEGGAAQGIGEALMEQVLYDEDGQLLTGSLMDYALPRAVDIPGLRIAKMETPSPTNILGAKGVGEAGTIGAPVAILNAALDALEPLGVTELQMPLTACKVWQAIREAEDR
jgi:carbon-monoxide dehydrogenase large subunit